MAKPIERARARELRADGAPLKRIAAHLGVSVSSVHAWTRDIALTPGEREYNQRGPAGPQNPEQIRRRVEAIKKASRSRRSEYQEQGRQTARAGNPMHLAGCMLYWAEGAKARNALKLTNSDPNLVRFYRQFLDDCFQVPDKKFRVELHVYLGNGLSIDQIESHWMSTLSLPRSCARKHYVNPLPTSSSGRKKNKLPYGVCTLSVHNTQIVQHVFGAIQEYAGFDEPRWLDGPRRSGASS